MTPVSNSAALSFSSPESVAQPGVGTGSEAALLTALHQNRDTQEQLHRHGISRLPPSEDGSETLKKKFKDYPLGYLHLDFAEVHTEEGKQ